MNKEFFIDGISAIHVTGNLVRIDGISLQPQLASPNGQPVVEISQRIIMPIEGFIEAIGLQQKIVRQLIEAGIVKQANNETPVDEGDMQP